MVLYGVDGLVRRGQVYDLLALGAKDHWGLDPLPELARGDHGKPHFPSLPHRQFSLSHSGTLALAALSDRPVGVDIQVVGERRTSFPPKVCSPEELDWLAEGEDYWGRFAQLWALKECRVKESGRGLTRPISAIRVPLFRGEEVLELEGLLFRTYAGKGWRGALCGRELPPETIRWVGGQDLPERENVRL